MLKALLSARCLQFDVHCETKYTLWGVQCVVHQQPVLMTALLSLYRQDSTLPSLHSPPAVQPDIGVRAAKSDQQSHFMWM